MRPDIPEIISYYRSADQYAARLDLHPEQAYAEYADFVSAYLKPGARVLDIGCGTGIAAGLIQKKGYAVTGIDLSLHCLGRARAARPGVRCACADATRLPFHDASFDGVIIFQVIEHVSDIPALLHEMVRVTSPGGRIIILSPNLLSPFNIIMPFLERGKNTYLFGVKKKRDAARLLFSHTRLLIKKMFSPHAHFSYRTPVLENRVDFIADNDAVYLSCPVDFKRFFSGQRSARMLRYQACGRIGRLLPDLSTGVYIVAEVLAAPGGKL